MSSIFRKIFAALPRAEFFTPLPALFAVFLFLFFPGTLAARDDEPAVSLDIVSLGAVSGSDVRLKLTLSVKDGRGLCPAMLDAACFRIDPGDGKVLVPRKEGLSRKSLDLAGRLAGPVTVSRTVNVGSFVKLVGCRTVKAWWEFGNLASEKISFTLFPWPLDSVEAVIETEMGTMTAEFFPSKAPRTVANFVKLSMEGFYDGLTFHRIIPGFMIQGGCPNGDGTGGPGYTIKAEFNDISHERGVLSMARGADPDSAGSQFFIVLADTPALDGKYTVFGKLTSGYEVLDRIAAVKTETNSYNPSETSRPVKPPKILKIRIRPVKAK